MKTLLILLLPLLVGCSMVRELKKPPFPYAIVSHQRLVGVEAAIPNNAGDSVFKFRLGIVTHSFYLLPCATNKIHIAPISDNFVFGQAISLSPDTSMRESLQTGFEGPPPPLQLKVFKDAETRTNGWPMLPWNKDVPSLHP